MEVWTMFAVSRPAAMAALVALLASALPLWAQDPPAAATPDGDPAAAGDLFEMVPATGRHLKIDRRTGRVSLCEETDGRWACRLVADDRLAYEEEIARLESENGRLRERIAELEGAGGGADSPAPWISPEDERRLDEFLTFSDKAMRRLFGMVQDFKRDLESPPDAPDTPETP
jgi:hypothetical protein